MEQPVLKLAPLWDAGIAGGDSNSYAVGLAPEISLKDLFV